jgi:hypothetical protein
MNNTISWLGNKVFDPSGSPQGSQYVRSSATEPMQSSVVVPPDMIQQQGGPLAYDTQQGPPPSTERGYIPYYLASNIGKNIRAEFIIGSSQYTDRVGRLIEVGINYFVLDDVNSRTHVMCDLYSVKFVTVLQS